MLINKFFISSLQEFKYYLKLKTSKIVKTFVVVFSIKNKINLS